MVSYEDVSVLEAVQSEVIEKFFKSCDKIGTEISKRRLTCLMRALPGISLETALAYFNNIVDVKTSVG